MIQEWKPHPRQKEFLEMIASDCPITISSSTGRHRRAAILNIAIKEFEKLGLIEVKEIVPGAKHIRFKTNDPKTRRYLQKWFDNAPYL